MTKSLHEGQEFENLLSAIAEIDRLRKINAILLKVCKLIAAALAVGNGINRRSQPIGGKTYASQLKAAIATAEKHQARPKCTDPES